MKEYVSAKEYSLETKIPVKYLYEKVNQGVISCLDRKKGGKVIFEKSKLEEELSSLNKKELISL